MLFMNKDRFKVERIDLLREKAKNLNGEIVGNSMLTGLFSLGTVGSILTNGSLLTVLYGALTAFFGYGVVASIKEKNRNNNQIKYEEEKIR